MRQRTDVITTELAPDIMLDAPGQEEPHAVAVFAHGLGDTNEGMIAHALSRALIERGIAIARVHLAERHGRGDLIPLPFSSQTALVGEAAGLLQGRYPGLSCHRIGHSQGVFAALDLAIQASHRGHNILVAPPFTNPSERLLRRINRDMTHLPSHLARVGIVGYLGVDSPYGERYVGITEEYLSEAACVQPAEAIREVYAAQPTLVAMAEGDEVLGSQMAHVKTLPSGGSSEVVTIPDTNHIFRTPAMRRRMAECVGEWLRPLG